VDEDTRTAGSQPVDRSPEEIEAEIERTRAEVGDTVAALAAKTDVKAQAKQRVENIKTNLRARTPDSAQDGAGQVSARVRENPAPFAIGGAVLLGFLLGRLTSRGGDD